LVLYFNSSQILRDDERWTASPYRKMRLWRYRGYDLLKCDMCRHYD
jgi:hypothetical protein